jgi:hypothetical protein
LRFHRRLEGAFCWCRHRLNGSRCFACSRLLALHAPWQSYRCNRTPLPFEITAKGLARLAGDPMAVEPADDRLIVHL